MARFRIIDGTLSDGTVMRAHVDAFAGLVTLRITCDTRPKAGGAIQWLDGPMYLVMRGNLVPIRDAHYGYAETIVGAQRRALSFFIDNGEGTLEHARREGIDVSECY